MHEAKRTQKSSSQRNILIDALGKPLMCDYGLSRIRYETTRIGTLITDGGSCRHLAPELARGPEKFRTTEATDIYSFSMTIIELGTLLPPYHHYKNELAVMYAAINGERPAVVDSLGHLSAQLTQQIWNMLLLMWNEKPEDRSNAADIVLSLSSLPSALVSPLEGTAQPVIDKPEPQHYR